MRAFELALALGALAAPLIAQAETPVERGRYLVETIAGCGNCHTPMGPAGPERDRQLAGGLVVLDIPVMRAVAPNITPDVATGIGAWSDAEIARAIREGVRPDGRVLGPPMPFGLYRGLADEDLAAIVAYLRTVPPVTNAVERSTYSFPLPESYGPPVGQVQAPGRSDPVAYGAYLAGPVGHCIECHTPAGEEGHPDFAHRLGWGGFEIPGPWGVSVTPDITPTALGAWSDAEIVRAITTGVSRDGRQLMPPMAYAYYAGIAPDDLAAIVAYLRTLKPSAP
jgi:mono/diheme cytochrome c family protein